MNGTTVRDSSLSPEIIVPEKEKQGKEHEKERVRSKHRSMHKIRV